MPQRGYCQGFTQGPVKHFAYLCWNILGLQGLSSLLRALGALFALIILTLAEGIIVSVKNCAWKEGEGHKENSSSRVGGFFPGSLRAVNRTWVQAHLFRCLLNSHELEAQNSSEQ